jgi:hypothetical protein
MKVALTNAKNVFGISEDRAELTGACSKSQLLTSGPIAKRLDDYFSKSCFTTPRSLAPMAIATAFGNSGTGIVDGPGQVNVDLSMSKLVALPWPRDGSSLEFRAEFFNVLNHPQFANPDSNFASATFGVSSSTAVNARVGQLGLKLSSASSALWRSGRPRAGRINQISVVRLPILEQNRGLRRDVRILRG